MDRAAHQTEHVSWAFAAQGPDLLSLDQLLFRDYLFCHPGTARDYAQLKFRLAAEHTHDRIADTAGKSEFIKSVVQLAKNETT